MSISINFWNKNYVTVSLYLANMDGSIGSTNKSQLNTIHENGGGVSCPTLPPTTFSTCTIIDGMALIYNMEYNMECSMYLSNTTSTLVQTLEKFDLICFE